MRLTLKNIKATKEDEDECNNTTTTKKLEKREESKQEEQSIAFILFCYTYKPTSN
jgi:hypothetical protein